MRHPKRSEDPWADIAAIKTDVQWLKWAVLVMAIVTVGLHVPLPSFGSVLP
jgi:hypothetical protein